ncbi:alpha/beta fold hydrolase [Tabrizicola sp.]|uniref:alpha/beta fold hydrolase n=1 Tax=Tabrizicola sp. TaxID=2005166 RepID=UPI0026326D7C|nr:alpha/beta fold hydrolase [Tabrizicola sp.]MDM7930360.1 alpha/beta fold hydrolase [Tabrizicola sp.]
MMSLTLRLSDGQAVHVIDEGAGPPVLLLHGVGLRAEVWEPQIAALGASHRVIAADLPGHGTSAPLPGTPALPDYVGWAARLITALDLGPVAVAGHSMGALIALGLAVERPDLITRAALICPVYRRSPEARTAVLTRAEEISVGRGGIDGPLSRWFGDETGRLRVQVAGWLRSVPQAGYAAAYRAFATGDMVYADGVKTINRPLLVLTADGDTNSSAAMAREMAALAPQGRAVVIPGHRHMVPLTAPDTVNAVLRDWLADARREAAE